MTIKELAEVAGVSQETVRRNGKRLFPERFINGVKTNLNESESVKLMADMKTKNNIELPTQNVPQNVEVIAQAVAIAMQSVMMPMMEKMLSVTNRPLQIEQPKQDHFTLMAYCSLHHIKVNLSEAKKMGMDVKKLTIESGKEINTIPDERWGKVNSYPVEILEEYFSV